MSAAVLPAWYPDEGQVTSLDRLSLTFFFALIAHLILILGITFTVDDTPRVSKENLEIVLVPSKSKQAPQDAKLLAQANQDGGGESDDEHRPSSPMPAPMTSQTPAIPESRPRVQAAPPPPEVKQHNPKPVLTAKQSPQKVVAPADRKHKKPDRKPKPKSTPVPQVTPTPRISATELMTRSLEMASLNASIEQRIEAYSKRPRRKFINSRTREYKYAAYMEAWRAKVEKIGNLNYPDLARRERLSGSLLLDVSLNPDGTINELALRRSSGHKVLDDAALRIVRMAAPYAPFPKNIRAETDILHIERTWQFLGSNKLFAR